MIECKEEWKHMITGANDFEGQGFPDPEKEGSTDPCDEAYMFGFEFRKQQEEEDGNTSSGM